uniref:SFRICE_025017 n=1 Tax=Spodoptera frugiperda TaxID=7108 RepID=A0A2H1WMS2_SPOFR
MQKTQTDGIRGKRVDGSPDGKRSAPPLDNRYTRGITEYSNTPVAIISRRSKRADGSPNGKQSVLWTFEPSEALQISLYLTSAV